MAGIGGFRSKAASLQQVIVGAKRVFPKRQQHDSAHQQGYENGEQGNGHILRPRVAQRCPDKTMKSVLFLIHAVLPPS